MHANGHLNCRSLKRELIRAQEEIKRIQSVPLVIGQFMEAIDQKYVSIHACTITRAALEKITNCALALESCNPQPVQIMSSVSCPHSTARN